MIRQYLALDSVGAEGARKKAKELAANGYEVLSIERTNIPWDRPEDETDWHLQRFEHGYQIVVDTNGNSRQKIPEIWDVLENRKR